MIYKSYQQLKPESENILKYTMKLCRKSKIAEIINFNCKELELSDFILKNQKYDFYEDGNKVYLKVDGRYFQFEELKSYADLVEDSVDSGTIKSKMPGKILKVCVDEGVKVSKGDSLLIIESMKMENTIQSPIDGSVESLLVKVGDLIEADQILINIKK